MTERVGAIVLGGGRSSRFGRDKLAEPIDGRPLLDHAIRGVQSVADDVVVVAAPGSKPVVPPGVRIAHDAAAFEGPLAGVAAGLAVLDPSVDRVVVVAGDMPTLVPAVLERLVAALGPSADGAVLEVDGRSQPLPMAVRSTAARAASETLLTTGERRLHALPDALRTIVIPEATWRQDDLAAATLNDIDTPADLGYGDAMTTPPADDLRTRAEARVKAREDFRIHLLIYVLVNGFLWIIWFTTDRSSGLPWPAFASLGWGIGLVAHWWTVYGVNDARREEEIQKEMRRLRGDRD